jgi:hypothetical protein
MKGSIALFTLSKMAMIFFLFAIVFIISAMVLRQKDAVCEAEANGVAAQLAARVAQVVNAPAEDERRVFALEPSLKLASGYARYFVNASYITVTDPDIISFYVVQADSLKAQRSQCTGAASTPVKGYEVNLGGKKLSTKGVISKTLQASVFDNPADQDKFFVVIKCDEKCNKDPPPGTCGPGHNTWPPRRYLFISGCTNDDESSCLQLNTPAVNTVCGW